MKLDNKEEGLIARDIKPATTLTTALNFNLPGYISTPIESNSIRLTRRRAHAVPSVLAMIGGICLSLAIMMPVFLALGILLVLASLLITGTTEFASQKAVRNLMKTNGLLSFESVYRKLGILEEGTPTYLHSTQYTRIPSSRVITVVQKEGDVIRYTHFTCIPEEQFWLDNFETAMTLD